MKINPDHVFYSRGYTEWNILQSTVNALKEFKSKLIDGNYCPNVLIYAHDDNIDVIDKYRDSMSREDFFNRCAINIQFFVRTIRLRNLTNDFISENNILPYHISLINRLYLDEVYAYDWGLSGDNGIIVSADKRPFGNSYIEGDILDELAKYFHFNDAYLRFTRLSTWGIYGEVINIFPKLVKLFPMEFRNFTSIDWIAAKNLNSLQSEYYNHNWAPSISEFRDLKIDQILN